MKFEKTADTRIKMSTRSKKEAGILAQACRNELVLRSQAPDPSEQIPRILGHLARRGGNFSRPFGLIRNRGFLMGRVALDEIVAVQEALEGFASDDCLAKRIKGSASKNGVYDNGDIEKQTALSDAAEKIIEDMNSQLTIPPGP